MPLTGSEVKNEGVVKKSRPSRLNRLLVGDWVVGPIEHHLRAGGRYYREEVAFMIGHVEDSTGYVTNAILPTTYGSAVFCSLSLDVAWACHRIAKEIGQIILAQIHTHPGGWCGHSGIDSHGSVCESPGFLSFVVPHFAYFGLDLLFSGGACIHELTNKFEWRELPQEEISERFSVVPAAFPVCVRQVAKRVIGDLRNG